MQIPKNLTHILTYAWLGTWLLGLSLVPFVSSDWFFEPHDTTKWMVVYGTTLLASFFLLLRGNVRLPTNKNLWIVIGGLFGLTFVQSLWLDITFSAKSNVDRLLFVFVLINFYNFKKEHLRIVPYLVSLITIPIALGCLHWLITAPYPDNYLFAPFFGNINMVAQFCGLAIILLAFYMQNDFKKSFLFDVAVSLAMVMLYYSFCRSVILGLAFALIPIAIYRWRNWQAATRSLLLAALTIVLLPSIEGTQREVFSDQWKISKQAPASNYRLELWKASLDLFSDNVLGVGPGRLPFSVTEYKLKTGTNNTEQNIDFFTHNEFIRYLVEDGLLYFGLLLLGLIVMLFQTLSVRNKQNRYLIFALCIYLVAESLFQFPFMLAAPYLIAAAIIVLILKSALSSEFTVHFNFSNTKNTVLISCLCAGITLLSIGSYRYLMAEYLAFNERDKEALIVKACEYNTENWRACLFAGNLLIEKGRYGEGEKYLRQLIEQQPGNFTAFKHLSKSAFRQGNWPLGCKNLNKFDSLLSMKSSLHPWLVHNCTEHLQ